MRELGSFTGVPGKFEIVYFIHAVDCALAEFHVHKRLANYRATGEFFDVPIGVAVDTMDEAAKQFAINMDPSFATVGLPNGAVKEGRERVNAATANSHLDFPLKRITG